jgi:hypothetical protein
MLFAFLLGLSIVLGAHLNNAVEEVWPSRTAAGPGPQDVPPAAEPAPAEVTGTPAAKERR